MRNLTDILFIGALACAVATGASLAVSGCGCSDSNEPEKAAEEDAASLPEDVTPASAPDAATAVSASGDASATSD